MKKKSNIPEGVLQLKSIAASLEPSMEKVKSESEIEEVIAELEKDKKTYFFELVKSFGTLLIGVGAFWALTQGVLEYRYTREQRDREQIVNAMRDLSDK